MITICKPIEAVDKIIENTKIIHDAVYRLSDMCVKQNTDSGVLLYNTMTCELLFLENEESELLKLLPGMVPKKLNNLVAKHFLVTENSDEQTYCNNLRRILAMSAKKEDAVTKYTILTTTDCNARCFYCYEMGRKRISMSEATARATGEYIVKHCQGKKVSLTWFGGEPLFNVSAIDTIVKVLCENNIIYSSAMISNGYLFDRELVKKAKEAWHLNGIQISLDGTEDIYNRRKAYIHREGSAYRRVLHNIGLLLESDIPVSIRLNLDMNNQENLHELVDELAKTFVTSKKLFVYNYIIFETHGEPRSAEKRKELYSASSSLTEHINQCGLGRKTGVWHYLKQNQCMADDDAAVTVMPDGGLGKCEHFSETEAWGNIWSEEKDNKLIEEWKEVYPLLSECKTCFRYPICFRLKKCPNQSAVCDSEYREQQRLKIQRQMLYSFTKWKTKIQKEKEYTNTKC